MSDQTSYRNPFSFRYSSEKMRFIFSEQFKYSTWRKLWLSLAKAQKRLGLPISAEAIEQMEKTCERIDFEQVKKYEEQTHHEVMAHILAFKDAAPEAEKIIHLGCTSSFVMDNTDLIQMKSSLFLIEEQLLKVLTLLKSLSLEHKDLICLAYTHLMPAQPTTVGKRFALWFQDLYAIYLQLLQIHLPFLGVKGATGSQSSFSVLFEKDYSKTLEMENLVAEDFGFTDLLPLSSQTYPRSLDTMVLNVLSNLCSCLHKIATDMRLLAHLKEVYEPFSSTQVGSSAMPHKKNPILCERICSLSRFAMNLCTNAEQTASVQWLERSLDDSAGRRLYLSQTFLATDEILLLAHQVFSKVKIDKSAIKEHLQTHLDDLILEPILMLLCSKGYDRQKTHALLKQISHEKLPLFDTLKKHNILVTKEELEKVQSLETLMGMCPEQVVHYFESISF